MTLSQWSKPILLISVCVIWPIWQVRRDRRLIPDPGRRRAAKIRARKIIAGFPIGCLLYYVVVAIALASFPW